MGWMPDFGYQRSSYRDSDKDALKFMKKKVKKSLGPLGKRLDNEFKSLTSTHRKGII